MRVIASHCRNLRDDPVIVVIIQYRLVEPLSASSRGPREIAPVWGTTVEFAHNPFRSKRHEMRCTMAEISDYLRRVKSAAGRSKVGVACGRPATRIAERTALIHIAARATAAKPPEPPIPLLPGRTRDDAADERV